MVGKLEERAAMERCPMCGSGTTEFTSIEDAAATHFIHKCVFCDRYWEEVVDCRGNLLHICPTDEEDIDELRSKIDGLLAPEYATLTIKELDCLADTHNIQVFHYDKTLVYLEDMIRESGGFLYTQVDTVPHGRVYSRGIHIANRTGMYAIVTPRDEFKEKKGG